MPRGEVIRQNNSVAGRGLQTKNPGGGSTEGHLSLCSGYHCVSLTVPERQQVRPCWISQLHDGLHRGSKWLAKRCRIVGVSAVEMCPPGPSQNPCWTHPMLNPRVSRDLQTLYKTSPFRQCDKACVLPVPVLSGDMTMPQRSRALQAPCLLLASEPVGQVPPTETGLPWGLRIHPLVSVPLFAVLLAATQSLP